MSSIITEELRFRKLICEYAIKHKNNAEALDGIIQVDNKYNVG